MWPLGVDVFSRYYGEYNDELAPFVETMLHKRVVVRLEVERTVSWTTASSPPPTRPAPAPGPERCTSRSTSPLGTARRGGAHSRRLRYYAALSGMPNLGTPEVLERTESDGVVSVSVRYAFTGAMSPAVQAVLDPTS